MKLYGKEVAKEIIKCRHDEFIFKKSGVFPKDDRPSSDPEFDACNWRYACELDGQDGQQLRKKPCLRIPFNENVLAAFFLHGWGWYVRAFFGALDDGPDDAAFCEIEYLEREEVKEVVTGAFRALRDAERIVGKFDDTLARMALKIDDAFWNAAPSKRTAEMLEALRMAYKKADEAESVWRKKMVNQLLKVEILPIKLEEIVAALPLVDSCTATQLPPFQPVVSLPTQTTANPVIALGKRWTVDALSELKVYRKAHTMQETAEKFGISMQRIRQLLPSVKPKAKPFDGLIHRMK